MNTHPTAVEFTAEEKIALAAAITKAAVGVAEAWDLLSQIGARIGFDWEPIGTSVVDIVEHNASDLENPAAIESLDPDSVAEYFSDAENWSLYTDLNGSYQHSGGGDQ